MNTQQPPTPEHLQILKDAEIAAKKIALDYIPYTDEGSLEDCIDASKRSLFRSGFIKGIDWLIETHGLLLMEKCNQLKKEVEYWKERAHGGR